MAEFYECMDNSRSGAPPPPPPPPPPLSIDKDHTEQNKSKLATCTNTNTSHPPPLNGRRQQGKSKEPIPDAPRLSGNPLSGGEAMKNMRKKKKESCCTML
ncbi:Hypothetical protein SRAE_2000474100 [Strongyloides ratti]|uniref:Uncharacterized protein n=1 Tax=Strongyloides ratti TaxID=34506 RepID=A0A090LR74_STRRB|nr:Hypothetical protein SRAE_2000474100 [Strongyloides ratti]CEF70101.1 Hypothetical protein SRAE_2000474100 [Strongyloides ratti]